MPDNRLVIMECEYDVACNSFVCNEMHTKKYYVTNPHSGALATYPVFCENCIKHLVANIPAELVPTATDIEQRLRAEMTEQYNAMLAEKMTQATSMIREDAEKFIAMKLAESESPWGVGIIEADEIIDAKAEPVTYRCLDCSEDFKNIAELNVHKLTHVHTPKTRSRKPATKTRERK